jgi:hypothetical protein
MSNIEDRDLLRHLEMISRVKPSEESTQRAMDKVRRQILTGSVPKPSAGPRIIRFIRSNPAIKVAVAACIVVAVTLTVVWYRPQPTNRYVATDIPSSGSTPPAIQPVAQDLPAQLKHVEALYTDRNVDGLIDLLGPVRLDPKVVALAAQSLGKIGDLRAIEPSGPATLASIPLKRPSPRSAVAWTPRRWRPTSMGQADRRLFRPC